MQFTIEMNSEEIKNAVYSKMTYIWSDSGKDIL